MALSRDQILNSKDISTREVNTPEWGGSVLVRALTLKEVKEWRRSFQVRTVTTDKKTGKTSIDYVVDPEKAAMAGASLLMISVIDESGNRVFTSESDIEKLAERAFAPVSRVCAVIQEISGLNDDANEEAEKNSAPSPSDDSSSL